MKIGIMGAGGIAGVMANTVKAMDTAECYAVASRNLEKARQFAEDFSCQKAYGSYEELVQDPEVELIYIATPHSEHYANAKLCISHGKAVLCEKSFTANEEQARELFRLAKEKGVLITEAIWTRYMPFLKVIKDVLASGVIGRPTLLTANLGYPISQVKRIQDPNLAGGALLDVGVYTLHFACMMLGNRVEDISSTCTYTATGVDEQDSITLKFKDGALAVLNSSVLSVSDRKGIIQGTDGFLCVENINNFERLTVYDREYRKVAEYERPPQISGYEYEVEACRRALEKGAVECEEIPHEDTLYVMNLMDTLRRQWGIRYPFE